MKRFRLQPVPGRNFQGDDVTISILVLKAKFHYADFPETSPRGCLGDVSGMTRGSRRRRRLPRVLARGRHGDVTGLSRTCRGEVGVMEFGL